MKKKVLSVASAVIMAISTSAAITAVMSTWVKVSDSCDKCVMNDTTRKCGKPNCGGFMESVEGTSKVDGSYIKSNYKCNKCGHTIIYKNK